MYIQSFVQWPGFAGRRWHDGGTMDGETRLCEVKHVSAWLPNSNVKHLIMGPDKGTEGHV